MVQRLLSRTGKFNTGKMLSRVFPLLIGFILLTMLVSMPHIRTLSAGETPTAETGSPTAVPPDSTSGEASPTLEPRFDTASADTQSKEQDFLLKSLGIADYELHSPSATAQFRFSIPSNWEVESGELHLNVEHIQAGDTVKLTDQALMSVFDIALDNRLVDSVHFTTSSTAPVERVIELPAGMLKDTTKLNHTVRLSLDATEICRVNIDSRVIVHSDASYLRLKFREIAPTLDLAAFPRPFFSDANLDSSTSTVILVLPTDKTAADLNTAATISAGLGNKTYGSTKIRIVDADKLTDEDKKNNHLIVIGQPDSNALIKTLYDTNLLPTTLSSDGSVTHDQSAISSTDGLLQLIANPDNPLKAILTVTGQSAEALNKAALALTTQSLTMTLRGSVAVVTEVRALPQLPVGTAAKPRITFADLGYTDDDLQAMGKGTRFIEISFNMPVDSQLMPDAYINLVYNGSQPSQGEKTTVSMTMNNITFASTLLEATANATPGQQPPQRSLRAQIPPDVMNAGQRNTLTIIVDTQGNWDCNPPSQYGIWFAASPASEINLPTRPADSTVSTPLVTWFPSPFNSMPDLHNVWISLPTQPTHDQLELAYNLIARIGAATDGGTAFTPQINLGDIPEGTDLSQYNIIAIGRPSTNPVIAKLNPALPQPFAENSDQLQQVLDNVTYKVSSDYQVGVLQTLKSPWSGNRILLVLTGNSEQGEKAALDVLLSGNFSRDQLKGDVVFASGSAVSAVDSRKIKNAVALLTEVPVLATRAALAITASPNPESADNTSVTATPTSLWTATLSPTVATAIPTYPPLSPDQAGPTSLERPAWLGGLLGVTLAVIAGVLLYGLFRTFQWMRVRNA